MPVFPEQVSVAMAEIAQNMQEGLLALAVGAGLQVMQSLLEADVTALAGPKGKHDVARTAVRHGRERGSVTLDGRRVPITAAGAGRRRRRGTGDPRLRAV
ncbi:MAG: transposase, mutator type, partial [Mycobacterium sp.]|nr:transposase, mutator type [Mycobacterium sp.]